MATVVQPLSKPAVADSPLHPLIAERWSPRAFTDQRSLLEAARWAPSAGNQQPWHLLMARKDDSEGFERMLSVLREGNQRWASQASVLMLAVAKQYADSDGTLNSRSLYDVGLAIGMLSVQATALGLAVHQMGGFYHDKARETLGIPDGYEPAVAIALGYGGDHSSLPEDLQARELAPRTRKPLREFTFSSTWGETAPFLD